MQHFRCKNFSAVFFQNATWEFEVIQAKFNKWCVFSHDLIILSERLQLLCGVFKKHGSLRQVKLFKLLFLFSWQVFIGNFLFYLVYQFTRNWDKKLTESFLFFSVFTKINLKLIEVEREGIDEERWIKIQIFPQIQKNNFRNDKKKFSRSKWPC